MRNAFMGLVVLSLLTLAPREVLASGGIWARVRRADSLVLASRSIWHMRLTFAPDPALDVDKVAAEAAARARSSGLSPEQAKAEAAQARLMARLNRVGFGYDENVTFTYDGRSISDDEVEVASGRRHEEILANGLDIRLGGALCPAPGPPQPMSGNVQRVSPLMYDNTRTLGRFIFLAGVPVLGVFSPSETTVSRGAGNTIVLTRPVRFGGHPKWAPPTTARLVIAGDTWRPSVFQIVQQLPGRGSFVACTTAASGYLLRPGGVFSPSRVVTRYYQTSGQPMVTYDYRLQSARFNATADLAGLKGVVPPGTGLTDQRFLKESPISYVVTRAGLPTDSQVWAMIQQRKHAQQLSALRRRLSILFYLGPLAVVLILVWRRRTPAGSSLQGSGADAPAPDGPGKRDGASEDGSSHIDSDAGPAP